MRNDRVVSRLVMAATLLAGMTASTASSQGGYLSLQPTLQVSQGKNTESIPSQNAPDNIVNVLTKGGTPITVETTPASAAVPPEFREISRYGTDIHFGSMSVNPPSGASNESIDFDYSFAIDLSGKLDKNAGSVQDVKQLIINGHMDGSVGPGSNSTFDNTYLNAYLEGSQLQIGDIFELGTDSYRLEGLGYVPPDAFAKEPGRFSIRLKLVPEPASLVMLGLGGLGILGMYRRRRLAA